MFLILVLVEYIIIIIKEINTLKHTYLTEIEISKALESRSITTQEADKLKKKMDLQRVIHKTINR